MKKVLISCIIIFSAFSVQSQYIKEFSLDTANYIDELSSLFGASLMDDEDIVFANFIQTWDSLEIGYRQHIMEASELMRQRSCRPRPHFIMFLSIMEEFHREGKYDFGYDSFIEGYMEFMSNEKTLLKEINLVQNSVFQLLDQNTLFTSTSVAWRFIEPGFRFLNRQGIVIEIEDQNIVAESSGDSIIVHNVKGVYNPITQKIEANSARVYWDRAGLDKEIVYAETGPFGIDVRRPFYKADSVVFYHKQLLEGPALGSLEDRISRVNNPSQAKYPRFVTYQSTYALNDIVPGVDYRGALAMEGANLAGTSTKDKEAELDISYNDTIRVHMNSRLFLFGSELIRSNNAEISIYLEDDSIYHPDLIMNYNIEQEMMRLTKSKDYNSQGPYSDSYHRMDMSFDELNWKRNESVMRMQAALGTALGNGLFESYDFFDMVFYEGLQGLEYQHPLAELWTYADMLKGNTFSVEGYAAYMGKAPYMFRQQLMQLSKLGFVYFDFERDEVTLRPKLYDYIDASMMQRDYDVIRFVSRTEAGQENAHLDLNTKDLTINGIPTIFLSDSQNVKLVPDKNSIIMKRNRDFQFDGVIDAGLFKFYGKNFFFEYDNFLINLQNIDSLSISALTDERDSYGSRLTTTLDNKIENITGELLIDAPFNKSGLNYFPEYPIFTSREDSYVYFDEESIQNGVYDKERFYFQLIPFSIDSLDNFSRDAMKLEGTFISADILPPLEMEMSLRPDNSLGFYLTSPEEGFPLFGGKATFFNDLEMSSAGLHGYGSLDYLTSTTWSDDFLFHPDSIMTTSRRFLERELRTEQSYPYVENQVASVRYYPRDDVMRINRIESTFKIFNDSTFFGGNLALRPSGLSGDGRLAFPDARFESEVFKFQAQRVKADSTGIQLKNITSEEYTFLTNDMSIDVNLDQREGEFTARDDYTLIEMPANLYETRLDQVSWFMDEDKVLMTQQKYLRENDLDVGIDSLKTNGPAYISKHPQQDSLHFVAPVAYFDYRSNTLDAEKVPLLEIGDSYVFPSERKLQVLEKATLKPLRDAKILANKKTRYHLLHSANLVVDSRLHFRGAADYDYVDEFGNTYTFRMNQVEVDTSITTFGLGEIVEDEEFKLSPYYDYKGLVSMTAPDPYLTFAGGVRLTHDCDISKQWLKFETVINPDSILIPVEADMQNTDLNKIFAGTMKARDSIHIYPTFLSGRKEYFDREVTFADGILYYDKQEAAYEIASPEKISDPGAEGNYLALRTDSCQLYGEGELDLQLDFGRLTMRTFGNAIHDIPDNTLDVRTMLGMNFYFSPEALNIFGNELDSLPDLEPADLSTDFYNLALKNMVGEATADKLATELGLYGSYSEIPDSMKYSILFNDVKLKWNQETRSYRYNGTIEIGTIGDVQVNRQVNAYMEFVERGSGDIFDIYLMANDETWYYLAFSPGALQVLSSNEDFNQLIFDLPDKDRKLKSRGRQKSYIYSLSSTRRLQLFLDRFLMYEEESQQN